MKQNYFDSNMIKKEKVTLFNFAATFFEGLIFGGCKCLHATLQKCALSHTFLFTGNYHLFAHHDVSYRFNGENDNVVLE